MESMSRICNEEWQTGPPRPTIPVKLNSTLVLNSKMWRIRRLEDKFQHCLQYDSRCLGITILEFPKWQDTTEDNKLPGKSFLPAFQLLGIIWIQIVIYPDFSTTRILIGLKCFIVAYVVWTCRLQRGILPNHDCITRFIL